MTSTSRQYPRLNASGIRLEIRLKNPMESCNIEQWMYNCFNDLLKLIQKELDIRPGDRVGFSFANIQNIKIDFNISFRRFDQYSPKVILGALDNVLQSNTNFLLDDTLIVNVDHVRVPIGCGRKSSIGKSSADFYKIHKSSIYNPDIKIEDGNICLPVVIVVGIAHANGDIDQNRYNYLTYTGNYDDLIDEAKALAREANVDYQNGCGKDEIIQFEEHLKHEYNLNVYNSRDGKSVYHKSNYENKKHINILLGNEHFCLIKSLTAAFASAYFCSYCAEPYATRLQHKSCPFKCDRCFSSPPCEKALDIKCYQCNRKFVSPLCFQIHINTNICLKLRNCLKCCTNYNYDKKNPHICGTKYCFICKEKKPIRHECYMMKSKPRSHKLNREILIFFDLECMQTRRFGNNNNNFGHEPNLCVAHQACDKCAAEQDVTQTCSVCGIREHIFSDQNIIAEFMAYIGSIPDKFKRVTIVAHNLQKYDGHFILQYMYTNQSEWQLKEDSLIINGSKILQIRIGRFRFIDSLNFFGVALAKLPSMFNLQCSSKGYYPHFFNTPENTYYIGLIPDPIYYGVDHMKTDDRTKFLEWRANEILNCRVFDNRRELIKYCRQDVNILRIASLKFRELMIELTSVDLFDQITIPGTCMAIFKTNFLTANQIAVLPPNGYRMRDNQSFKALKWLAWVSHSQKIKIMSAINGREVRIANNIIVDGYFNDTVYEFLGCYWHQCPQCFPYRYHRTPDDRKTFVRSLYETHLMRSRKIKLLGYNLVQIWEHEFDSMMKNNSEMREYIESLAHLKQEPLNPRDAFFGGRTGVCKLYHKVEDNEQIHYYDVTSLYPFVNKYAEYPIGVPKILLGKDVENRTVFDINGLIKCRILPPKKLYHPVLPVRMHEKLLFILCYQCAVEKNNNNCIHDDTVRSFDGTYVADELREAVNNGYEILQIYEAWEYNTVKYDVESGTGGIFSEYINTFLKIKTEASGYPQWCKTESDRETFISSFLEKEGVLLDKENIVKNPGLRSLAKICLNSIWGKFGERPDKVKKTFVNEADMLLNLVTHPSYNTQSFYAVSPESLLVSYKLREDHKAKQPNVNVVIAAYTTAHGRLQLYRYLKQLGQRVLYYDTDSVFFTKQMNEDDLPLGDFLGDLTDEICEYGEGSFIEEVVFTSEKSYAFVVNTPGRHDKSYICKVKGVSLNYNNARYINFETMKHLVLTPEYAAENTIRLNTNVILRTGDSTVL